MHNVGALLIAALTLCGIAFELTFVAELRFYNAPVDGVFFNMILLGYGLPAILAIALALIARTTRPLPYRIVAAITAVTLALFYLTLEMRRPFKATYSLGPPATLNNMPIRRSGWSSALFCWRSALCFAGNRHGSCARRDRVDRREGVHHDTASIGGIYRALSAIGLGVVLLGIGWIYQRLLYPRIPVTDPD